MRDEWEPKPFNFDVAEYVMLGALIIVTLISIGVGVSQWPAGFEAATEYETSMQETINHGR